MGTRRAIGRCAGSPCRPSICGYSRKPNQDARRCGRFVYRVKPLAVYVSRLATSAKVRVTVEFLRDYFREHYGETGAASENPPRS
ncbi:hypothetical protein C2M05_07670 [Serratia marcescens]|nr:hypothetical protein C2M05_07670 [Serratia marcescens]